MKKFNLMIKKMQNVKSDNLNIGKMIHENKFSKVGVEILITRGLTSKITAIQTICR